MRSERAFRNLTLFFASLACRGAALLLTVEVTPGDPPEQLKRTSGYHVELSDLAEFCPRLP